MAASNTTDISMPSRTASVTLPVETTSSATNKEGGGDVRAGRNSPSAYPYRLSSDIPDIPNIPSPLLRPPTVGHKSTAVTVTAESNVHSPFSSASVTNTGVGKYDAFRLIDLCDTFLSENYMHVAN